MAIYQVISGKHIIPTNVKGRMTLKTIPTGETFEASPFQVRSIMDKLKKISNNEQKAEKIEKINSKKEDKKRKFIRG